ncbi:Ring canal kelch homolog [Eumeta japonica]|uniref:Kelch-like protein diablo n=1 Tax=Eumeta variegata TaxID=151549 RepID=A0A4C1W592_EUMVA|nr:Ring canal kelch homolog [Eumeta japonica]
MEGFRSDTLSEIKRLWENTPLHWDELLCDVRLMAGDGGGDDVGPGPGVVAHRAVLAACSPYFRAMFTQFDERMQHTITIQNVEAPALRALVDYVYNPDSLAIGEDNVQSLLGAASLLQVGGVRDQCCAFLAAQLHADNALGIRAFADLHACTDLAAHAQRFIERHFADVAESEELLTLSAEQLGSLLASDELVVPTEEKVLECVLRWVGAEPETRRGHLTTLMEYVRLPLLSLECLMANAQTEPLLGSDLRCKDLLIEALMYHLLQPEQRAAAAAACPRARPRRPPHAPKALLVVGGQAPKAIRHAESLDLEESRWRPVAEMLTRRCRAGLAVVEGRVYAVGGFNGTLRVRSVDVYDPTTDTWSFGPSMRARRSTLGVAVLEHQIYAVGGFDGTTGLSSAEVLDTHTGVWREIASMSTRRSSVGVAVLQGKIYAVGGYDGASRQCLASVECYDPETNTWSGVPEMSARRSGAGVGVVDGVLYAVGGHDGPAVRRSVEAWRPGETAWRAVAPMAAARRNAGVAAHVGKLYVVGGDDGASNLPTVEVYEPASDTWTTLDATMAIGRSYAGVCIVDKPA